MPADNLDITTLVNMLRIIEGEASSVSESGRWAASFYLRQIPEERWPLLRLWAENFSSAIADTIRIKAVDLAREGKITAMQESTRKCLERDVNGHDYRFAPPQPREPRRSATPIKMEDLLA